MLADTNSDLEHMTTLLRQDTALTATVVRLSNSVIYAGAQRCASLEEAVARVGYAEVYRLIGFATTAQLCPQQLGIYGVTGAQLRENSLLTALIMEQLAPMAALDAPAAYTAGLLRSIGKIALDRLAPTGCGINYESHGTGPLAEWETAMVGMGNCDAAGIILTEWRFPDVTVRAVREHYRSSSSHPLAAMLNLAAGAAERCGHGWSGERFYWEYPESRYGAAGIDEAQLDEATRRALELFGPVRAAVG
jgi:HD-like signal output (HDOD) protein